ncbi:hypothetical protein J2T17_005295 [Paenibacillus mucilaginosus]
MNFHADAWKFFCENTERHEYLLLQGTIGKFDRNRDT